MSAQATSTAVSDKPQVGGRAGETRRKLLDAGTFLFAQHGYEATSTRQIETHAGVQRNLMGYHFGSKEEVWKACMSRLFARMVSALRPAMVQSRDIEPVERIRFLIRQFIRASAATPEINRIMFDEGRSNDWRLEWIVEHYVRDFFGTVTELFEAGRRHHVIPDLSPIQFYYLLVGSASMFSMAPECRLLSGRDPAEDAMVDAQADAIAALLTSAGASDS
jgi:AcrR family transcriptional regulator